MRVTDEVFKYVLKNSINGIIIVGSNGEILYLNDRGREILEISENQQGSFLTEFLEPEKLEQLQDYNDQDFHKIKFKDKILIGSRLTIDQSEEGRLECYILQDISKFESVADEINKYKVLNEKLHWIIESSFDGIFVTDGAANVLMLNSAYERITGIKKEDLIGKNMRDLVRDGVYSQSGSLMVIEKRRQITLRQLLKHGKEILITSTPVFSKDNGIMYIVTNVRDISELVNLKNQLLNTRALNERYLAELEHMKNKLIENPEIIVKDQNMFKIIEMALMVAKVDTTLLLNGETGVGKGQLSKLIHKNSYRAKESFIEVNCGAIPQNLIESELFGYEKGAFTGANIKGKTGLFELASKGTILLDEISELTPDLQVKLLKVLEDKVVYRIGGEAPIPVNARVIAATNKNLQEMVNEGSFREDLFYRLNVVPIYLPPLRERRDDIIPLSLKFLSDFNKRHQMNKYFSPNVLNPLLNYKWPGNVRELRNLIERMVVISQEDELKEELLPNYIANNGSLNIKMNFHSSGRMKALMDQRPIEGMTLKEASRQFEAAFIRETIKQCGTLKEAARILNIDPSTINRKLK